LLHSTLLSSIGPEAGEDKNGKILLT